MKRSKRLLTIFAICYPVFAREEEGPGFPGVPPGEFTPKKIPEGIINPVLHPFIGAGRGTEIIGKLISNAISLSIILASLLCLAYLIWGGIQWLTSGGEKTSYQAARDRITAALIGLMIVVSIWALVKLIGSLLGIPILGEPIKLPAP